ncbi:MAG TPA: hypothetical protein PK640_12000, partial [Verrucomicrobiota bacterium]|nr:hypothetical protein [Verrucomicrobiota bacterium]
TVRAVSLPSAAVPRDSQGAAGPGTPASPQDGAVNQPANDPAQRQTIDQRFGSPVRGIGGGGGGL